MTDFDNAIGHYLQYDSTICCQNLLTFVEFVSCLKYEKLLCLTCLLKDSWLQCQMEGGYFLHPLRSASSLSIFLSTDISLLRGSQIVWLHINRLQNNKEYIPSCSYRLLSFCLVQSHNFWLIWACWMISRSWLQTRVLWALACMTGRQVERLWPRHLHLTRVIELIYFVWHAKFSCTIAFVVLFRWMEGNRVCIIMCTANQCLFQKCYFYITAVIHHKDVGWSHGVNTAVTAILMSFGSKFSCGAENFIIIHYFCLNKLADWADTNGFKFSPSKTVCIHFCKLRKLHPEPTLLLNGTPVPVLEETKFLGIVFDHKLSFIPHIKHLKDKCTKALNLLRVLAHTSWGADQETLLHLYRSLIRSKLFLWLHSLWICS